MKYIPAEAVATALMGIFYHMGFLDVMLSENCTQFVSRTMRSVTVMLSIAQTFITRYHP